MYFANPTKTSVPEMRRRVLGYIDTPAQGNVRPRGVFWIADNGCFSNNFDQNKWISWLKFHAPHNGTCLFATVPDVVGNAAETLERSRPWFKPVREMNYPVAYVAQDGIERTRVPWSQFDTLFLGGSNEFKLGPIAREYAQRALQKGKTVHGGRVNSRLRYRYMQSIGATTVDGTFLVFGPQINLPRLLGWMHEEGKCVV